MITLSVISNIEKLIRFVRNLFPLSDCADTDIFLKQPELIFSVFSSGKGVKTLHVYTIKTLGNY